MAAGIYYQLYHLLQQYIYGPVELTPEQILTLTQISTIGSILTIALPFVVVFWIIRRAVG